MLTSYISRLSTENILWRIGVTSPTQSEERCWVLPCDHPIGKELALGDVDVVVGGRDRAGKIG